LKQILNDRGGLEEGPKEGRGRRKVEGGRGREVEGGGGIEGRKGGSGRREERDLT
jgi:hypothetical protein